MSEKVEKGENAVNSLPDKKISDWFKLKAFADDKLNMIRLLKLLIQRAETIVGKGENADYQHNLLFPQCFLSFCKQISVFSKEVTLFQTMPTLNDLDK